MAKKYIDADLLRKEIESRMGECDANSKNPNQLLWAELAALLPFIDSLQQEQPCDTCTNDKGCVTCTDGELWEGKEQPCEDLEEAAKAGARQYYVAGGYSPFPNIEYGAYKNGFIAGAEWQKEQMPMPEDTVIFQKGIAEGKRLMMEEAVEAKGVICKLSDRVWISPVDEEKFHQEVYVRFVVGQTVKIVIVPIKED